MTQRIRIVNDGEALIVTIPNGYGENSILTIEEGRQLSSDLSAALIQAGHTIWKRKQAEAEAARLAAQESKPWGLWSAGQDERGELVYLGVSWPGNIVAGPLPFDEAEILRDEHNAALTHGDEGAGQ